MEECRSGGKHERRKEKEAEDERDLRQRVNREQKRRQVVEGKTECDVQFSWFEIEGM